MSNLLKSKFFLGGLIAVALLVVGSTASAAYMHTGLLKMGMTSSQVMSLQQTLNGGGFLVSTTGAGSPGMESMYFGAKTKAAVMAFQAAKGLSVDGVVGAQSGAALAAMTGGSVTYPAGCTSTTGFSTTTGTSCASTGSTTLPAGCTAGAMYSSTTGMSCTGGSTPSNNGPLMGGAGDITVDGLSTYSSEEVGEDEENVKILAFEIEADDESDVDVSSVKVELFQGTAADSEDLTDYAESLSVWMGSEMVGEADTADFSENSDVYSKSISLDGAIVKAGETEKFYVAVTAQSTLDSGDIDTDVWYAGVSAVRFEDADGVVTTEALTLDVDEETVDDEVEQTFDFSDFATASDVELSVSLNDSDDTINEAHIVDVDDTADTNEVAILSFTLEAEGDSDINVTEIPVNVDVTGAANVDDMITNITLWMDDEEIASDSVGSGVGADETYVFQDLDIDIGAGDTVDLMVKVDFKSTADVDLDNADTISAQLSGTEVDLIEAEDESGENVSTGDLTGTAVGEAHAVYDSGIMFEFVSSSEDETFSADDATESDQGEFKITFKAMAFDADARVDMSCEESGGDAAGQGVEFTITNAGSNATTCILSSSSTDTEDTANTFEVDDNGQWRTFTLTVNATASTTAFAEVSLSSINWGVATDDTNANYYTFNLGDYKTDSLNLADL